MFINSGAAAGAGAGCLQDCADLMQVVPARPSLCPSQRVEYCEEGAGLCSLEHVGQIWDSCAS